MELSGAGIYFPLLDAQQPVRIPNCAPVYEAELLATLLALRRIPVQFFKVYIISDSLFVISSLSIGCNSYDYVLLWSSAPSYFSGILISRIPGRRGIQEN